jgi:hypothetical protein
MPDSRRSAGAVGPWELMGSFVAETGDGKKRRDAQVLRPPPSARAYDIGAVCFWLFRFFTLNIKRSAELIFTIRKIQRSSPPSTYAGGDIPFPLAFLSQIPLLIFTFGAYAFHCPCAEVQITTPARN